MSLKETCHKYSMSGSYLQSKPMNHNDSFLARLKAEADAAKAEADKKKAEKKAKKKKAKEAKEGEEAASSDEGEGAPPTEAPPAGNNGLLFNGFCSAVDFLDMAGIEGTRHSNLIGQGSLTQLIDQ